MIIVYADYRGNYKTSSPEELKAHVGKGWHPLIDGWLRLCAAEGIEVLKVAQVKEKFGGLRLYVDDDLANELVRPYEEASYVTCEFCGEPGSTKGSYGWVKTLCPGCRSKDNQKVWDNNPDEPEWREKFLAHQQKTTGWSPM